MLPLRLEHIFDLMVLWALSINFPYKIIVIPVFIALVAHFGIVMKMAQILMSERAVSDLLIGRGIAIGNTEWNGPIRRWRSRWQRIPCRAGR